MSSSANTPLTPPSEPAHTLPILSTSLSEAEVRARLDAAARKGRLPGFHPGKGSDAFTLTDFGKPFEGVLAGRYQSGSGGAGSIRFDTRLKPTMPWVMFVILILTVWPGVWLTDSMLKTYFSWYTIPTWWWYLPLTIPTVPWVMRSALRKSRASIAAEAPELIGKVADALGSDAPKP